MKNLITTIILALSTMMCWAQNDSTIMISKMESTEADYVALLRAEGYMNYSYDLSVLKDETYDFHVILLHYCKDSLNNPYKKEVILCEKNRTMIDEFKKDDPEKLKAKAIDPEHGVYRRVDKLSIGFTPANDSTRMAYFLLNNSWTWNKIKLAGSLDPVSHKMVRTYQTYTFHPSTFEVNKFIPLCALVSFWYEPLINGWRCCGKSVLDPDLSNDQLKRSPNYYIMGVEFYKRKE